MIGLNARNPERFRAIANQEGKPVKIRYGPATVMLNAQVALSANPFLGLQEFEIELSQVTSLRE